VNTYQTSDGERIKKSVIDGRIRKAKEQKLTDMKDEHGYVFCENCCMSSDILDCSHDIPVKECQEEGKSELAWDVKNITIRCRQCHRRHDKTY